MKTVIAQERIEGGEVSEKMGLKDRTRRKSVCLVTSGKWTMETKGRGAREGGWVLRQRSGTKILDRVRVEGTRETYA